MTAVDRPAVSEADLASLDASVRDLFERVERLNDAAMPDLEAIGAALVELAADLDYWTPWVERLGDVNGALPIHAPRAGHG